MLDPDRRDVRSGRRATDGAVSSGDWLSPGALHHLRELPRNLPESQQPHAIRRRGDHQPGAPVQFASDRRDARGRASRRADGARWNSRLRQRAELREGLPEGNSSYRIDRRRQWPGRLARDQVMVRRPLVGYRIRSKTSVSIPRTRSSVESFVISAVAPLWIAVAAWSASGVRNP